MDFVRKTKDKSIFISSDDKFFIEYIDDTRGILKYNIYMQGGCTDGINLYYILEQEVDSQNNDGSKYYKSVIIKVFCRQVFNTQKGTYDEIYYVNRNYVKPIKFSSGIHKDFIKMAHHGNDITYIPNLPIIENGVVIKKSFIMVCGSYSFFLIDPVFLEILENENGNLIYLKGLYDYAGGNKIKNINFKLCPEVNFENNLTDKSCESKPYIKLFKIVGLTYLKSKSIIVVNYDYTVDYSDDAEYRGKYVNFYRFETTLDKMDSKNNYLSIIPVVYRNGEYVDCDISCEVESLTFNPELYGSIGSIDTDDTRLFQVRSRQNCGNNNSFF